MSELNPETVVHGRYRIKRVIANGGMGCLYEAFDEQLERVVAIKQNGSVLSSDLFLSEAKLLARLQHSNLPAAIDVFEENRRQYFVMEYIDGIDLDQLLTKRKKISLGELSAGVLHVLDALNYLHTQHPPIIHRDIKPSNLIIAQGTIFLVDFGISKDTNHTRLSGSGTRQYASPEHAHGPTTAESDIYSFSATLYHLLTGVPTPTAYVRMQEVHKKGRGDPLVPAQVCEPSIGRAVSDILTKGLSLDPHDRYRSAADMRSAFERALQTGPGADAPTVTASSSLLRWLGNTDPSVEPRSRRRPRRARLLVPMLAALLLIACVSLIWARPSLIAPLFANPSRATADSAGPIGLGSAEPTVGQAPRPTSAPAAATSTAEQPSVPPAATAAPAATDTGSPSEPTSAPASSPVPAAPEPGIAPPPVTPAAQNTIRIALQSPTSGDWHAVGTSVLNGAQIAIDEQRNKLINLGFQLELYAFDDQSSKAQSAANARAIVDDASVMCTVGNWNSGATLGSQPVYAEANLVQISPGSTNPSVTDDNDNIWRVVGRDDIQAVVAADFARTELKSQRPYVLHDTTLAARAVTSIFANTARANGLDVAGPREFDETKQPIDFAPIFAEIQQHKADAILLSTSPAYAGQFIKQAREHGITAPFVGTDALDNRQLVDEGGPAVNGTYFTTVAAPVSEFTQAKRFAEAYKARYNQDMPAFAPESYDATNLCVQAIAAATRASSTYKPTREGVLEAMRHLTDKVPFQGISGNYRFNENGDPRSAGYYIKQVDAANWDASKIVKRLLAPPPAN
jgi:ABC-type branched-subunit amino acid transport system substrate-binding protein